MEPGGQHGNGIRDALAHGQIHQTGDDEVPVPDSLHLATGGMILQEIDPVRRILGTFVNTDDNPLRISSGDLLPADIQPGVRGAV